MRRQPAIITKHVESLQILPDGDDYIIKGKISIKKDGTLTEVLRVSVNSKDSEEIRSFIEVILLILNGET